MDRPRFRFGLRTMLFAVLTLVGCWLGWQASIVRERRLVLSRIAHCGGYPNGPTVGLPWAWRQLGATSVINLDTGRVTTKAELDRLHRLFPETENVQGQWEYLRDDLD